MKRRKAKQRITKPSSASERKFKIEAFKAGDYRYLVGKQQLKQIEALRILDLHYIRTLVFGGGAGGGKTWLGCEWLLWSCLAYPDTHWFMGRKELAGSTGLKKTTLITFLDVCRHHRLVNGVDFKYTANSNTIVFPNPDPKAAKRWEGGSQIMLLHLKYKPDDPKYERFGSTMFTGGFIEEGGEIPFAAFDMMLGRTGRRNNNKYDLVGKVLVTCNPKRNWLYKEFVQPHRKGILSKDAYYLQALVDDNKRGESGYKATLQNIKDPVRRRRLLHGDWEYDDDATTLYYYDSLTNMFTNAYVEEGKKYITADIARMGSDWTVVLVWSGFRVIDYFIKKGKTKTTVSKKIIRDLATQYRIPMSDVVVDEDGVGGGVVDELGCKGFVNNSRAKNGENYSNLATQCAYKLAEIVNANELYWQIKGEDGDPELEQLIVDDFGAIKRAKIDDDSKLQVNSKKEQKGLLSGRSPDLFDAAKMRMYFEVGVTDDSSKREVSFPKTDKAPTSVVQSNGIDTSTQRVVVRGGRTYVIR